MNTTQVKKIAMYRAVEALLRNATETNGLAALAATWPLFVARLDEVHRLIAVQERPLGPSLAERNRALHELEDATLALAGIALSYADQRRLDALAINMGVTEGDFRRARLDQRIRMAQHAHDAVMPHVAQLADFGVTTATLENLQRKIDTAATMLPAARGTSVDKKAATMQLAAAIRAMDAALQKQIDPLLLPLRKTHPQFYERYQVAREVVGRPGVRGTAPTPVEKIAAALPVAPAGGPTIAVEKLAA